MKRKLFATLLVLVMLLGLAACGTKTPSNGTDTTPNVSSGGGTDTTPGGSTGPVEISVAFGALPNGLDPCSEDVNTSMSIDYHIYDNLLGMDVDFNLIPGVAKSWKEIDALTWTFEIDLDHKFQNGEQLTMEDVVYSILRIKDIPKTADTGALIQSVTYEGTTLTITATEPNVTIIPRVIYSSPIVNKAYIESGGDEAVYTKPIGTGPYKVTEFTPGTSVTLETWDDYPFEQPQINKINFTAIAENSARYIAVESGQLQYAGLVTAMESQLAVNEADLSVITGDSTRYVGFGFNCEKAPFDNVNVRRAIVHAIDRESISMLNGGRPAVKSMLFGGFDLYSDPESMPEYDLEAAKALLEAEGYNESNPLKFTVLLWQADPGLELIQSALRGIGVEMTLDQVEFSVFLTREGPGDFEGIWTSAPNRAGTPLTDLDRYDYRMAGTRDITRYYSAEYDAIADEMRITTDSAKQKSLALQAHEIIGRDVPMVGLYLTPIHCVMDSGLSGVTVRGDMIQSFRYATYNP